MSVLYKSCVFLARPFIKLIFPYKVDNANCIPEEGDFIICSNHISMLDPILIALTQKRQVHFVAKSELFKNKIIGNFLTRLGAFPVERGSTDINAVNKAVDILNNKAVLGIFYEGTRSKDGELLKPKAGVTMIASQTSTPVIPCCITSSVGIVKPFKKIRVSYGDPLTIEDLNINTKSMMEIRNATKTISEKIKGFRQNHTEEFQK